MINIGAFRSFGQRGGLSYLSDNCATSPYLLQGMISFDRGEPSNTIRNDSYLLPLLAGPASVPYIKGFKELAVCGLIVGLSSRSTNGEFMRLCDFDIVLTPFKTSKELIEFFCSLPDTVMGES
jgi:hypothetical protein